MVKGDPAVSGKCNPTVSVKFDPVAVSGKCDLAVSDKFDPVEVSQNAEGLLITPSDSWPVASLHTCTEHVMLQA